MFLLILNKKVKLYMHIYFIASKFTCGLFNPYKPGVLILGHRQTIEKV